MQIESGMLSLLYNNIDIIIMFLSNTFRAGLFHLPMVDAAFGRTSKELCQYTASTEVSLCDSVKQKDEEEKEEDLRKVHSDL